MSSSSPNNRGSQAHHQYNRLQEYTDDELVSHHDHDHDTHTDTTTAATHPLALSEADSQRYIEQVKHIRRLTPLHAMNVTAADAIDSDSTALQDVGIDAYQQPVDDDPLSTDNSLLLHSSSAPLGNNHHHNEYDHEHHHHVHDDTDHYNDNVSIITTASTATPKIHDKTWFGALGFSKRQVIIAATCTILTLCLCTALVGYEIGRCRTSLLCTNTHTADAQY
jgi:hypothetical protein